MNYETELLLSGSEKFYITVVILARCMAMAAK
jgi:hypothetical protein